jgi:hypothetical protein
MEGFWKSNDTSKKISTQIHTTNLGTPCILHTDLHIVWQLQELVALNINKYTGDWKDRKSKSHIDAKNSVSFAITQLV